MSVQQRLTTPSDGFAGMVAGAVLTRRAAPWLPQTIDDVAGGSQSLPELADLHGLRCFGLPEPTRQRVVRRSDWRYYLDAELDPAPATVEINGVHHLYVRQKEFDHVRRTRLAIGGRLVVDIGSYIVRHYIALAVLLTADALLSRGWEPARDVRQRLLDLAAAHPTFTWTSHVAA